jgi:hypothetical protein
MYLELAPIVFMECHFPIFELSPSFLGGRKCVSITWASEAINCYAPLIAPYIRDIMPFQCL